VDFGIMNEEIKPEVKVLIKKNFKCDCCRKEMGLDDVTFDVTIEKFYEPDRCSGIEVRLCSECAKPLTDIIGKVKALRSMKPLDNPKTATNTNKYDEGNETDS
jgi:hypothetical protein